MEHLETQEELTDEQLNKEIEEKIDGEEVETSEEPEKEELEEETEETVDEEDQVIENLEEESTSDESEVEEETEEVEETSEEFKFKSQEDAEKSYQNLLELQKRQATELGEIRKQLQEKQEPPPTQQEDDLSNLSNEDLAELVITDPTKAVEVMQTQIMRKMTEQQQTQAERQERAKMIQDSETAIDDFFKLDANKDLKNDAAKQEGFFAFVKDHHSTKNPLTVETLTNYHNWMNYDSNLKTAQVNARGETIKDLNEASPKVKTLSTAKNAKAKGKPEIKDGMTREQVQDIAMGLTEEELDAKIEALEQLPQQ